MRHALGGADHVVHPRRIAIAAAALVALAAIPYFASIPDADAGIPAAVVVPNNDAGVLVAPPRQFAPVLLSCDGDQKSILIDNPYDTDQNPGLVAVRLGSSRVRAFPVAKKNGFRLEAGRSTTWDVAKGVPYVISEGASDAGVALGILCFSGGTP